MPDIDLSRLAPLYRHDINQIKVTDPLTGQPLEGVLEPNKRVNMKFPKGQLVDPSTVPMQEIQGAIQQASEQPPWQEFGGQTDIIDLPDEDYNLARISSKRQFLDDMKLANELMPGSPEYLAFAEEAQATFRARNAKINMEREKSEMKFKEIRQNPNLDPQEKERMMVRYYSANPIYKAPPIQEPAIPEPEKPITAKQQLDDIKAKMELEAYQGTFPELTQTVPSKPQFTGGTVEGSKKKVQMISPDFKLYEIDESEVSEALKNGWRRP
jgi:hypothetical protein